jgi:hypothetical protein
MHICFGWINSILNMATSCAYLYATNRLLDLGVTPTNCPSESHPIDALFRAVYEQYRRGPSVREQKSQFDRSV